MKKNRMLLLLLGVFVLPFLLAKTVLDLNWYQGGVTNRGQLLASPLTAEWLSEPETWQLVYLLPESCDEKCEGALFNLRQVPQAIGAYQDRVNSVVLITDGLQRDGKVVDEKIMNEEQMNGLELIAISQQVVSQIKTLEFGMNAIYIADPLGNVMMAYPLVTGQAEILAQGKDVLRDLKRLLKLSRIG
jgi:hypothetical protein